MNDRSRMGATTVDPDRFIMFAVKHPSEGIILLGYCRRPVVGAGDYLSKCLADAARRCAYPHSFASDDLKVEFVTLAGEPIIDGSL